MRFSCTQKKVSDKYVAVPVAGTFPSAGRVPAQQLEAVLSTVTSFHFGSRLRGDPRVTVELRLRNFTVHLELDSGL